jgi:hypothetical protein
MRCSYRAADDIRVHFTAVGRSNKAATNFFGGILGRKDFCKIQRSIYSNQDLIFKYFIPLFQIRNFPTTLNTKYPLELFNAFIMIVWYINVQYSDLVDVYTVGSRFATIHFYDPCPVGPSTPHLWCITVATQASFLYLMRF